MILSIENQSSVTDGFLFITNAYQMISIEYYNDVFCIHVDQYGSDKYKRNMMDIKDLSKSENLSKHEK